ncbi:hypothetical protein SEPCBS57363_001526 [Sporothrix epigloea]|uniref:Copper homeostasis protein cutC homolog n=1 Tax=Sporothrix epigloea TaxID=1892477 RepID=A0ABP0DAS7_9PEZI
MPPILEVPIFSPAAATVAVDHGAARLEINRAGSYAAGGLTPTLAEVEAVADAVSVPLRIMIRPRGPPADEADFLYTDETFQQMRRELAAFVASGLLQSERGDGFVFGILKKDGITGQLGIDMDRNRQLVQAAGPCVCIFHRAFDLVLGYTVTDSEQRPEKALATIRECGFSGVLTAGGPGSHGAVDHAATLQRLIAAADAAGAGDQYSSEIIVGGGVRSSNVGTLMEQVLTGKEAARNAVSFHSSCLVDSAAAVAIGAEGEGVSGVEVERIGHILALL